MVANKRMDPTSEREARLLEATIERIEAQIKGKDQDAKNYMADIEHCRQTDSCAPEPD